MNLFGKFKGLKSQFTCGRHDESSRACRPIGGRFVEIFNAILLQTLVHGQQKGSRLATARASHGDDILAEKNFRYGFALYGRGLFIAAVYDAFKYLP
jgi:hypothetical protein